jgi:hypothetical protein
VTIDAMPVSQPRPPDVVANVDTEQPIESAVQQVKPGSGGNEPSKIWHSVQNARFFLKDINDRHHLNIEQPKSTSYRSLVSFASQIERALRHDPQASSEFLQKLEVIGLDYGLNFGLRHQNGTALNESRFTTQTVANDRSLMDFKRKHDELLAVWQREAPVPTQTEPQPTPNGPPPELALNEVNLGDLVDVITDNEGYVTAQSLANANAEIGANEDKKHLGASVQALTALLDGALQDGKAIPKKEIAEELVRMELSQKPKYNAALEALKDHPIADPTRLAESLADKDGNVSAKAITAATSRARDPNLQALLAAINGTLRELGGDKAQISARAFAGLLATQAVA